ncbi:phospho-N-acetylmuramoyl-pentapeptide-transferase [Bacillus mexicanus]|uniref:phospho-N-acetylmuramoyl-pentapeptide- transferase n=1 Tax=Bacillus mexicanus TaxID=2834415 RepID=UPI003D248EED
MNLFLTLFVSFFISIVVGPFFIKLLRKFQFGQSIREEGPESHKKKSGTPTLGGIIFLIALTISTLLMAGPKPEILLLLFITLGNGAIGFLDDFIKIAFKRNLGLTSKQKLLLQMVVSIIFLICLSKQGMNTNLYLPGTEISINFHWFYYIFVLFLVVGTSNATNLTDGLDGLLTGTSILSLGAFATIAMMVGSQSISLFSISLVGGLLGFLIFNKYPAKVFMGDTGSLAIGGALVGIAVLLKMEVMLAIIGGVYVIETLSVIIQVLSFKIRKKRVFKMSPLHHHFELSNFSETQVVKGFWATGFVLAAISLLLV